MSSINPSTSLVLSVYIVSDISKINTLFDIFFPVEWSRHMGAAKKIPADKALLRFSHIF